MSVILGRNVLVRTESSGRHGDVSQTPILYSDGVRLVGKKSDATCKGFRRC